MLIWLHTKLLALQQGRSTPGKASVSLTSWPLYEPTGLHPGPAIQQTPGTLVLSFPQLQRAIWVRVVMGINTHAGLPRPKTLV